MKNLCTFDDIYVTERLTATKRHDIEDAIARLNNIDDIDTDDGIHAMFSWFKGELMGMEEGMLAKRVAYILGQIGKVFHDKKQTGPVFRIAQLQNVDSADAVKSTRNASTGPKQLQSWSTTERGARWFYNHFVHAQNKSDIPNPTKAWVLLKTDAENLQQLLTFEDCMDYLEAVINAKDTDREFKEIAVKLHKHFYSTDMKRLHELICLTPSTVPVEIVSVLVPPGQPSFDDMFNAMFR